ncbi:hypothetical protein PRIPAC_81026 [Pristionchus pacificus]|uniref:Uncharacterized protein n=1 Tax=Pristionchus pacificus TaxID=54126 RepID=A0A2A6CKZ2_PRIPA|nr:hypothetical protein PRIPAC_81026 [Pristionchus pacificus]|eukprot:PDM78884.1 hypothetical protein PRIPAC_31463 [Pristionchus pacificus]
MMNLWSISLLLLVFLIPFADPCIPTKTPEPGIPATTANPNNCPLLGKLTVAECNVVKGPLNLVCAEAIVSSTSVTCAATPVTLLFKTGPGGSQGLGGPLTCKGTTWNTPDGMPLQANLVTSPVACVTQGSGK